MSLGWLNISFRGSHKKIMQVLEQHESKYMMALNFFLCVRVYVIHQRGPVFSSTLKYPNNDITFCLFVVNYTFI